MSTWTRQVVLVAVPYQIYIITQSSFAVGLLGIVLAIAMVASGLYGGGLIDRFDRGTIQIAGRALAALTSLLLVANALWSGALWLVFALSVVGTAGYSISNSARSASIPRMVDPDLLPAALAIGQVLQNGGAIIGPALGGVLIAGLGLPWTYAVDVIAFLPAVVMLRFLSPLPPLHSSNVTRGWRAPAEGLRFVRSSHILIATMLADLGATVFGMPTAIFPALALSVFHVGPTGLGLLYSAPGVGALVGALFSGWVSRVDAQGRLIIWSIALWGVAIAGFGLLG
ncbi:MAG: MFS transporter, partial [Nitrososphaerales archaeon]